MRPANLEIVIQSWKERVTHYHLPENQVHIRPMESVFIEPYVINTRQAGIDAHVLITTTATRDWYDHPRLFDDLNAISRLRMIKPGDVVFDLGASHGVYSVFLSYMAGTEGRVYAFEPFRMNADHIRHNSLLNQRRVEVIEVAISNSKGPSTASLDTLCLAGSADDLTSCPVQLDQLDNYLGLKPDFLKIDVEGAEVDVLKSGTRVIAFRPNFHIEVHTHLLPKFGYGLQDLYNLLPLNDYLVYVQHPGCALEPFTPDPAIPGCFSLYFVKEPPNTKFEMSE